MRKTDASVLGFAILALTGLAMPAFGDVGLAQGDVLVATNETIHPNAKAGSQVFLAAAGPETDANVARCDELTSGYEFRDVLDARGYGLVAIEDIDAKAALAACGAALDSYPDHLRSRFHYARAMEASAITSLFPYRQDPDILEQATLLHSELCEEKLAISCHNAAGNKLRMGHVREAQAMLEAGCQMDKGPGAGASCSRLGQMFEDGQVGQIGQKKTLKQPMPFTPWDAAMDRQGPAVARLSLR